MNDIIQAINRMSALPDVDQEDSEKLKELSAQSAREIKILGGVSAATSLEMIAYMRQLEWFLSSAMAANQR
jgi:hypothetical protein